MTTKFGLSQPKKPLRRGKGFAAMSGLIENRIRKAGEKRGFAVMRLLTHWSEIVGNDMAVMARPIKVGYGREGFGATLTVLTSGVNAPLVQMQLPAIRDKVNACYGYSAISRVQITQTAPAGFAEGQTPFKAKPVKQKQIAPQVKEASAQLSQDVKSNDLRLALEALGENVMSRKANS